MKENEQELAWKDSFLSLKDALERFTEVVDLSQSKKDDIIIDATIKRFEFTLELFWKTLKKILAYEKVESTSPRDVVSKAFQINLIDDEHIWLTMLDDRNLSSHVYNQKMAREIFERTISHLPILQKTYEKLKTKYSLSLK